MPAVEKNRGGRPAIGVGAIIGVRWRPDELEAIDQWRLAQTPPLSRVETIRRLVRARLLAG